MFWQFLVFTLIIFSGELPVSQDKADIKENISKENFQQKSPAKFHIDIREKHAFTYEALKDIYNSYITDVMKTLAFLLICIGWFITSDKSREFFKRNNVVRISSIIALIVLAIIHMISQINTYIASKGKMNELITLNYFDLKYYQHYEITLLQLITNAIQNIVLFIVLILIILLIKKVTNK